MKRKLTAEINVYTGTLFIHKYFSLEVRGHVDYAESHLDHTNTQTRADLTFTLFKIG